MEGICLTCDLSLAHLKELIIAVLILEEDYDVTIERLKSYKVEEEEDE